MRRYAIALLTKLILTHPYGVMHGGLLRLEEWKKRYTAVSKELKEAETTIENEVANEGDEDEEEEDAMEEDERPGEDEETEEEAEAEGDSENPSQ